MFENNRKLRVFLCHSSHDKPIVRELYQRLLAEDWIDPWLDEEKLLPGQDWDMEIEKAVESTDAVLVFLSNGSITKEGYVQKELRKVLDIALEKPDETIFVMPLRLENCELPRKLRTRQAVDYFPAEQRDRTFQKLLQSMRIRFQQLNSGADELQEIKVERQSSTKNIFGTLVTLAFAKGSGTVDAVGTMPLILYFALAALYVLTSSDSTSQLMVGIFAVLTAIFLVIRKQIPSTIIFKVAVILFLAFHVLNYTFDISFGKTIEGLAALIACGSAIMTVRVPKKPIFYSSISLASFLFVLGSKEIVNVVGHLYPNFFYPLMTVVSLIVILLLIIDL